MKKLVLTVICTTLIFAASVARGDAERDLVQERFQKYLEFMKNGQSDLATSVWLPDYIYNVYKFGISYTNAPFKFDCASPLTENLSAFQDGKLVVKYSIVPYAYGVYKILLTLSNPGSTEHPIRGAYYMMKGEDANFYLVPNYWPLLANMKVYEGKYYNLYYFKDKQVNDSALAAMDSKIESMAARLGISDESMQRLSADKLNYLLCENPNQVKEYSGHMVPGWHNPADNFVISSYLPHSRILADFLIVYKLRELPLHTIPFMDKGLAVDLGGRAGARLDVFAQMVEFSLKSDFLKLEDILSSKDFDVKTGGPDFAYTLSGYFIDYLIDKIGMDNVLTLYKAFSGDLSFVDTLSVSSCKAMLEQATGMQWAAIEGDFADYTRDKLRSGISFASSDPDGKIVYQSGSPKYSVTLFNDADELVVDALSLDGKSPVKAALIIRNPSTSYKSEFQSTLFDKHFPEQEYSAAYYSIIFGPEEIGTYDYLTDEITSKYIVSLSESQENMNPAHLIFKFKKALIPADFSKLKIDLVEMP
jgi:hypothetical protein